MTKNILCAHNWIPIQTIEKGGIMQAQFCKWCESYWKENDPRPDVVIGILADAN